MSGRPTALDFLALCQIIEAQWRQSVVAANRQVELQEQIHEERIAAREEARRMVGESSRAAARLDSARTERDAAMAAKEALEREKREWASSLDDLLEAKLQNEEESAEKIKELEEKMEAQLDEHRKIVEGMDTENRRLRETVTTVTREQREMGIELEEMKKDNDLLKVKLGEAEAKLKQEVEDNKKKMGDAEEKHQKEIKELQDENDSLRDLQVKAEKTIHKLRDTKSSMVESDREIAEYNLKKQEHERRYRARTPDDDEPVVKIPRLERP